MAYRYDLLVIGTGSAGAAAAGRCRQAGWTVGIVDERPFGGTCALRGCDPKKVLVAAARLVDAVDRYADRGVMQAPAALDWAGLMRFKRTFTEPVPDGIVEWLKSEGIEAFHGAARFTGEHTLAVGDAEIEAEHILIAAGSVPAALGIPGEELLDTSENFLNWDRMPARVLFVGGGYISFEFAHVALRAGAQVTILHRDRHPLAGFDAQLVDRLLAYSRDLGLDLHLDTEVVGVRREGSQVVVEAVESGRSQVFFADAAVHGAGRIADLEHLDLDRARVSHSPRGVAVNDRLQSVSNPAVYAAGDGADTPGRPLTPVAVMEGNLAAEHLLGEAGALADYRGIPTAVYTIPALAAVGMREDEARQAGMSFTVNRQDTTGWYSSRHLLAPVSGFAVLVEEGTDRILGAHVLGPHAEEQINLLSLAIRAKIPASTLRHHPYAYPTGASDLSYML